MTENMPLERNKEFVIGHFDDFVNKKDLGAIDRNMAVDFYDHDGPGGKPTGREGDKAMMAEITCCSRPGRGGERRAG